ncbi:phosphopyruvate hydratase [Caldiplasma sukawensis]
MQTDLYIEDSEVRVILDSRGNRTVEATIYLNSGHYGTCSAPSGASTGETEVQSFRNGSADQSLDFFYRNVRESIRGFSAMDQSGFDALLHEIDGTENFSEMGGNLSTALSVALAKAIASYSDLPLYRYAGGNFRMKCPKPLGNVIGGGKHAINGTTIQEILVTNDAENFLEAIEINALIHKKIGRMASDIFKNVSIGVGDERAWVLSLDDEKALEIASEAAKEVGKEKKVKTYIGIDAASTSYYDNGKYKYREKSLTRDEQIDYMISLQKEFSLKVMEDPMMDSDFEGFAEILKKCGKNTIIVGDDLYTTNVKRIRMGIEKNATNGALIKVNQIGTLTDTWDAVIEAKKAGMKIVTSHRSGETEDNFIAHLSVAFGSDYIKSGTIGGERLAKLNELVRIQEDLQ